MNRYYDTGIILKLYTVEPESSAVRRFVIGRKQPVHVTALHRAEVVSALRLKAFRGECEASTAAAALADFDDDLANGVLRSVGIEWDPAWAACRELSDAHAAATGCRTLDALHVACARLLAVREFVTADKRQADLARRAGMRISIPY